MSKSATVPTLEPADAKTSDSRLRLDGSVPEVRAVAAEALVRSFADALGLKLDGLTVAIDQPAAQSVKAHGARGRTLGNLVELDPAGFDPAGVSGRALLAHELTHAAQARLAEGLASPSLRRAETEAEANAAAAGLGRPLLRPMERWTGPALDAGQKSAPKAVSTLASLVAKNYSRELRMIEAILDDLIVTDGKVERVLRVLEPLAFETASALVGALEDKARLRLIREVNTGHYDRFRREVIAALAGLTKGDIGQLDEEALADLPFDNLEPAELIAVQHVYCNLPLSAQTELAEGDRKADFGKLRRTVPGEYDAEKERKEQALAEEQRSTSVVLGDEKVKARVLDLVQDLLRLLESPDAEEAKAALRMIADLNVRMRNDPRSEPEATEPTSEDTGEPAERGKTDKENPPSPKPSEPEPAKPPPALSAAALRIIAADLDEAGAIGRLIDALPEDVRRSPEFREPFRQLVQAREAHRNLALVEDLLDPGWWIFGWVDRQEAMLAYDVVMAMPLGARERFRQLENGEALRRMLDALPRSFRESANFELPEVARTADGKLIEADRLYAPGGLRESEAELVGATLELFRKAAEQDEPADPEPRWNRLLAIARADPDLIGRKPVRADAVLATVVRRLDAEGLLEPFLADLPADLLAARETWRHAAAILTARDPMLARAHILRLLNESEFLWLFTTDAVEADEALLAFQLVRALPQADRDALEAADGGEPWARMMGQLSHRTLAEASFTYFRGKPDSIRERLNDDRLWAKAHKDPKALDQLIVLIEMARAASDFAYVFDYSKLLHDAGRPAPQALVDRFGLYDSAAKRTASTPIETSTDQGKKDWLKVLLGTGWREIETRWITQRGPEIMGSEYGEQSLSHVRVTADLEQLQQAMGGQLTPGIAVAGSGGPRMDVNQASRDDLLKNTANVVDVQLDLEKNNLKLVAPRLRLSTINFVTAGATLRTGPVNIDNLYLSIDFQKGDLVAMTNAVAEAGGLSVETPVFTTPDSISAARRAVLTTLKLAIGDFSGEEKREPLIGSLFGLVVRMAWRHFVSGRSKIDNPLDRVALYDRMELSFDSLTVDEFQTSGGQRIGQTTVEGVRIAAATNRAAYQRLLLRSLAERKAKATDPAEIAALSARIATAEQELDRLAGFEKEYRDLVRKMNRQDGRLSEDESKRLAELQEKAGEDVASHMGAVVDVGRIKLAGIEGAVQVDDLEFKNLHGEGEFRQVAGFTAEQLTTKESIRRFVEFGPEALQTKPADKARPDNSFALTLGTATLNGLTVEAEIPSALSLLRAYLELPAAPEFNAERVRLFALAARVLVYEFLRRMPEPEAPADRLAHRRRLTETRQELARLFGAELKHATFTDIAFGAFPGVSTEAERKGDKDKDRLRDDAGIRIGTATLSGARYGAWQAEQITAKGLRGAVQLQTPGLDQLRDADRQVEVALVGGEEVTIQNLRQGETPNRAGKIVLKGFDGILRLTDNGLEVKDFVLNQFTVADAHYRTATSYLWSQGDTKFNGIKLDLTVPFQSTASKDAESKTDDDTPAWSRLNTEVVRIQKLQIASIAADNLGWRGFDSSGGMAKEVVVESGTLGKVEITNFSLDMPKGGDLSYSGDITVQTLDAVNFGARIGESFQARGVLDDGRKDRPGDTPAIRIGLATSGDIAVDLDQVQLTQGVVDLRASSGKGRVLVRRADISGQIGLEGDTIRVKTLPISVLDMPMVRWQSKDGGTLTARNAIARDLHLRLDYTTESETKSTVVLYELRIGSLTAAEIEYDNRPGMFIILSPEFTAEGYQPLIKGLLLQDLTVNLGADSISMSGGHGRIYQAGAIAVFGAESEKGTGPDKYKSYATGLAQLSAKGFTFEDFGYSEDGVTLTGGVESISLSGSGEVGPSDPAKAPKGALTAGGDVSALEGKIGRFRIGNNMISIGPDGSEGLVFPEILLTGLSFDSGDYALIPAASQAAEKAWEKDPTANASESQMVAKNLKLRMDIHLRKKTEEAGKAAGKSELGPVERIDIHQLHLDSVAAQGYRLYLRQKGVYIDIPAGIDSTIGPIDLEAPLPDKPFSISFTEAGPKILGNVLTGPLIAKQIGVQMGKGLRARLDFQAKAAKLGFLAAKDPKSASGPIKIDLTDWSATNILGYIGEGTNTSLRAGRFTGAAGQGIGGKALEVGLGEDGSLSVKLRGLWARGFTLRDKKLGLTLKLDRANMPDEKTLEYLSNPEKGAEENTVHKIKIDELTAEDAELTIDSIIAMVKALGKGDIRAALNSRDRTPDPGAPADTEAAFLSGDALDWITKNETLFRTLTGSLKVNAQLDLKSFDSNLGEIQSNIDLTIREGRVDFDTLEDQMESPSGTFIATAAPAVANLTFDPNKSTPTLVFGVGGHMPVSDPSGRDPEIYYADLHRTFVEWPLRGDEYKLATRSKRRRIGLDTLARAQDPSFGEPKDEDEEPRTDSIAEQFSSLRINNFDLKLSTSHKQEITVTLGEYGSLNLAPDALKDLHVFGNLQKLVYPSESMKGNRLWESWNLRKTNRTGEMTMELGGLAVSALDVKLPAFGSIDEGSLKGGLTIADIRNLTLAFTGLVPGKLEGTVGKIGLKNIVVDLHQLGVYGPEPATPEFEFDAPDIYEEEKP